MPTESVNMPIGPLDVASGAQNVTVSFEDGVGEWQIRTGTTVSAHGHWLGQRSYSTALVAGETLTLTGTGVLVATADSFTSQFNALDKLTL